MRAIDAHELSTRFAQGAVCLINCLSYEERSLSVARALSGNGLKLWLCIYNDDTEVDLGPFKAQAGNLCAAHSADLEYVKVFKRRPLTLADGVLRALSSAQTSKLKVVIDISTMTHELLLIVLAALLEYSVKFRNVTFIYNQADKYSSNERDIGRKWLSRGIHGVRSVIGYSGLWSPGDSTTLVALPGFDLERVKRIAEELEPEHLLVGIAKSHNPDHNWMDERNRQVADQLAALRRGNVFEYDALSLENTASTLFAELAEIRGNIVIAPLNSKVSTLAVGLLALNNPKWQVCYAPALVYNIYYSTPSPRFLMFSWREAEKASLQAFLAEATFLAAS